MSKKYLYCPKCKNYPDKVQSEEVVYPIREWDDELGYVSYYDDVETGSEIVKYWCVECAKDGYDTELINIEDIKCPNCKNSKNVGVSEYKNGALWVECMKCFTAIKPLNKTAKEN